MKKLVYYFFVVVSVFFVFHCKTDTVTEVKFDLKEEINKYSEEYEVSKKIRIHFATNRKNGQGSAGCSDEYYSSLQDQSVKYGICDVNVPYLHDIGNLDYDLSKSDDQSFKFSAHYPLNSNQFLDKIKTNPYPEIIVFVHGFNVKFEEAVMRAAQIKYDLKFPGEVVLYTWPAGSEGGLVDQLLINKTYENNFQNAQATIPLFKNQLNTLINLGKKVHIIVHSMGHQVVLPAIHELYKNYNKKILEEIVLNAPDFESVRFAYMSSDLQKAGNRVTVYCSPGDNALVASSRVNKNARVGSCEKIPGIDMINVNPIDAPFMGVAGLGHGYYSSRPILTDLYQVLIGVKVKRRLFVRKSTQNTEDYVLRR